MHIGTVRVGRVDQISLIQLNMLSNKDNQRLETIAQFGSIGGTATQSFKLCPARTAAEVNLAID